MSAVQAAPAILESVSFDDAALLDVTEALEAPSVSAPPPPAAGAATLPPASASPSELPVTREEKEARHRSHVLAEVVSSETAYVSQLAQLMTRYHDPLLVEAAKPKGMITKVRSCFYR